MADSIKIGNLDISSFKVGSDDCKVYLGDTLLYPTTPPTPTFEGKWKATYSDSHTESAECSSDMIEYEEITLTDLVDLQIGDCVTTLGVSSLNVCITLTSVTIPDSVTTIGNRAFSSCSGLTSIVIPDSVTYIGTYAFRGCRSLTSVTVNATTPPTLGSNAFNNTNDCPIYVPCDSIDAYKTANRWSAYASRFQAIPNS